MLLVRRDSIPVVTAIELTRLAPDVIYVSVDDGGRKVPIRPQG